MKTTFIRTASAAALLSLGLAAPASAQDFGVSGFDRESDSISPNPSEAPDITVHQQMNPDCVGFDPAYDCAPRGRQVVDETGSVYRAPVTGRYVDRDVYIDRDSGLGYDERGYRYYRIDPLADATSNPIESGRTDTTIQQLRD